MCVSRPSPYRASVEALLEEPTELAFACEWCRRRWRDAVSSVGCIVCAVWIKVCLRLDDPVASSPRACLMTYSTSHACLRPQSCELMNVLPYKDTNSLALLVTDRHYAVAI